MPQLPPIPESVGECRKEASETSLDLRIASLHQGGDHVEQVGPRLFHFDGPQPGSEHQRTNGVTDYWSQHVKVLLRDTLQKTMKMSIKRALSSIIGSFLVFKSMMTSYEK